MRKILPDNKIESAIKCPICGSRLSLFEDKSFFCEGARRHCYDISSSGYVNLMPPGHADGGDSKAAVAARRRFLNKDYYRPAAEVLAETVRKYTPDEGTVIDAGCGEGYYTSLLSEVSEITVGFDLSKFACSAGAKQAKRDDKQGLIFATSSVFELPIKDNCADALANIFAPCAEEEYKRILRDGGYLFVVGAGKNHLMGLKRAMYESLYENGPRADLPKNMEHVECVISNYSMNINGKENIAALFSMTPYYWRTSEADKQKLASLESLETEIEFEINVYRK